MAAPDMTQTEWMMRASEIVHFTRKLVTGAGYVDGQIDELRLLVAEIADAPPPHRREPV
jgi:hypothetical protein